MPAVWTAPRTWNTGDIVTAVQMNSNLRDNLEYLKAAADAPANSVRVGSAAISGGSSTTFVDVDSALVLSITTGGAPVLIGLTAIWKCSVGGADCVLDVEIDGARIGYGSYGVVYMQAPAANTWLPVYLSIIRPLAAGAHTLRLQYRVSAGSLSFNHNGAVQFYALELK